MFFNIIGPCTIKLFTAIFKGLNSECTLLALPVNNRQGWKWRHDIRDKGIQHKDTQYNDTQHNDTQHNDTQHYDTQHNDTQYNDT
jgi:hypothetical protein